jgi:uncharacterized protein (DUF488 family)
MTLTKAILDEDAENLQQNGFEMIGRHRALLRLLAKEGGRTSKLRLVKLAFLVGKQASASPKACLYEFFPYHHGPFSFTLYHELRTLERDGWVRVFEQDVALVQNASLEIAKLDGALQRVIDGLSDDYRGISTDVLVSNVYRDFPWYTMNSRNVSRRAATAPVAQPAVYSVGYEGLMLDGLLDLLLRSGVNQLIDVRCNPVARRFGFHRSTLERHCGDVGIAYVHIPELGIPSSWRAALDDLASYEKLFERYEGEVLPRKASYVEVVGRLVRERPSALLCMEADPVCCHRTRLARQVATLTGLPLKELRSE